ncbi:MAG TPA: hypothetical protein VER11_12370 [Polyangiaceae bacterium]|nr:hypothetical protein [Polyangiaceae bacterium]
MLGSAALSELPISALSAAGPGSVAVAVCTAVGQGSVAMGRPGTAFAAVAARASARVDRELTHSGFTCASSVAFAVGRADFGTTAAIAHTRVLPPLQAHSQALNALTSALTTVREDRRASSLALPLVVTATTVVLPVLVASSRPDESD